MFVCLWFVYVLFLHSPIYLSFLHYFVDIYKADGRPNLFINKSIYLQTNISVLYFDM